MKEEPSTPISREHLWRREPTAAEQERLLASFGTDSDARLDWQADIALTRALRDMSNVPLASNFTARVLQAVETDRKRRAPEQSLWGRLWRPWGKLLPRLAVASATIVVALFAYDRVEQAERVRLLESVSAVSEVAAVPSPEILRDFEAIQALNRPPGADVELLSLLQ